MVFLFINESTTCLEWIKTEYEAIPKPRTDGKIRKAVLKMFEDGVLECNLGKEEDGGCDLESEESVTAAMDRYRLVMSRESTVAMVLGWMKIDLPGVQPSAYLAENKKALLSAGYIPNISLVKTKSKKQMVEEAEVEAAKLPLVAVKWYEINAYRK
jgi:hypothetical protein